MRRYVHIRPLMLLVVMVVVGSFLASVTVAQPPISFAPRITFPTNGYPELFALVDLNGDNRLDVAVPNSGTPTLSVLLGDGAGGFGLGTEYPCGNSPSALAAGDLNNDGWLDLAVAVYGSGTVAVLFGDGAGHFGPRTEYGVGTHPHSVAVADLDGDGDIDMAVANAWSDCVSILLNHGNGTFSPAGNYATNAGCWYVVLTDVSGDSRPDMIAANHYASGISLLLNNGDGTFGPKTDIVTGASPRGIEVADLDRDGKLDLAVANTSGSTVSVLPGNGDGTFGPKIDLPVLAGPNFVAASDLDGDGWLDLAVANFGLSSMSVLPSDGAGGFEPRIDFEIGNYPNYITTGDLNGDGRPDVVSENLYDGTIAVLLNTTGTHVAPQPPATCITPGHPCVEVPVTIAREEAGLLRGFSVSVQLSADLELCGASISEGDYLGSVGSTGFMVVDNGGGSYTVDCAILGEPCGVTALSGTLFTVNVGSSVTSGAGTVSVTEVSLRDCGNPFASIPAWPGDPASITIDNTLPDAIASLTAAQLKSSNDADGTTVITLTWPAVETGATVELFRKGFGAYPEYDDLGGAAPPSPTDPAAALLAGWTSVGTQVSPYSDETDAERDFYYYVAFVTDACGNVSAVSNQTGGTLNYHLGDVMPAATPPPFGDNHVEFADVSFLGGHYGVLSTNPLYRNILDIGPTTDSSTNGRPTTDNKIQFEDLIILAINYGGVSKPMPAPLGADRNAVSLAVAPGGDGIEAVMTLSSTGAVQGLSIPLLWNAEAVEPIGYRESAFANRQAGQTLVVSPEPGTVDAAVFGSAFSGEGELAVVTFRVIGSGAPAIRFGEVIARDGENHPIALVTTVENRDLPVTPMMTRLLPSAPNPFLGSTQIRFALAEPGEAAVRVYALDGRLVRTLIDAALPAGDKSVTWDGRDEMGRVAAAGAYIVQFRASDQVQSQRVMRLR